jgi:hypothetical protein
MTVPGRRQGQPLTDTSPSMVTVSPVIQPASSESRNAASFAVSSGVPRRLSG